MKALHFRDENELIAHSDKMEELLVEFGNKWADLMMVAEERTKAVAEVVIDALPTFAQLAIPLPGAVNRASLNQCEMALDAMTGLSAHMLLVMRKDMGLLRWRQWKTRWELRFNPAALKLAQARSKPALDLTESDEPGGAPTPFELLRFWEVRQLSTNDTPASADGYYADNDPYDILNNEELDDLSVPESQAILVKNVGFSWRFGMVFGLPDPVEQKLKRDVCLIVTGHNRAFEPELRPFHSPTHHSDVWLWKGVGDAEAKGAPERDPGAENLEQDQPPGGSASDDGLSL